MSALCSVDNSASAFVGEKGCAFSTPLGVGCRTTGALRLSRCFNVTHRA